MAINLRLPCQASFAQVRSRQASAPALRATPHLRHLVAGHHHHGIGVGDPHVPKVLVVPQPLRVPLAHIPQRAQRGVLDQPMRRHALRQAGRQAARLSVACGTSR